MILLKKYAYTAFKFGGIISIGFWSMTAVVISGIVGRFIYLQIPRSIQGKELSIDDLENLDGEINNKLRKEYGVDELQASRNRMIGVTKAPFFLPSFFLAK